MGLLYLAMDAKFGDSFMDQANKLAGSLNTPPKAPQP
jgi:hypothetical protein